MSEMDLWSLPDDVRYDGDDIVGYTVAASDGPIGAVVKASAEPGRSYLVLSPRPWLDAAMVMLPAGLIAGVDRRRRRIAMQATTNEVAGAPPFAPDRYQDGAYLAELAGYYSRARRQILGVVR